MRCEFIFILFLVGCVELRDKQKPVGDAVNPVFQAQNAQDLVVTKPMYFYEGEFRQQINAEPSRQNLGVEPLIAEGNVFFNELILKRGAALFSMGSHLRIHVKKLTSENGTIATFPSGYTANSGEPGQDGGHLYIEVESATGSLNVDLRGQNGGQGRTGSLPDESMRGSTGVPANKTTPCLSADAPRFVVFGGRGGKGKPGQVGQPGFRGGDSGTLDLFVHNSDDFTQVVRKIPGNGGLGGRGGPGGFGGFGGDPLPIGELSFPCNWSEQGPVGPTGDEGPQGPLGEDGRAQPACIQKNQEMVCF